LKVKNSCERILNVKKWTIRELAQVIGQLIACFPGVLWGPLYYRKLEEEKKLALTKNKGNFDAVMTFLSHEAKQELRWWYLNIETSSKPLQVKEPDFVVQTDASMNGFGGSCGGFSTNGRWTTEERGMHINVLELLAIEYRVYFEKP
jgi:hypothetical protein